MRVNSDDGCEVDGEPERGSGLGGVQCGVPTGTGDEVSGGAQGFR